MAQYPGRTDGGRPAATVAEDVGDVARRDISIAAPRRTGWWRNAWLIPIVALLITVMVIFVPPFRTMDGAKRSAVINPNVPGLDYGLIVAHVLFSVIALVTVCLGAWPWLRVRYPAVHRWSGRVYVFSALPAALLTLPITYLHSDLLEYLAGYTRGVFWFVATLIGYVAMRRGNQVKHRRWMLYSFATATSVAWGQALGLILTSPDQFPHLMEVALWGGPLINLLAVKWWLYHAERRAAVVRSPAGRAREPVRQQAA